MFIFAGNILLLAEGRPGFDNTFSLTDGILRIELDKPTYERAGLQGQVIPDHGRRHVKSRYAITFNLRFPSMVKGKSGFDRVIWAAEHVFTDSLTWLFYDLRSPKEQGSGPIKDFQPFLRSSEPETLHMEDVLVPSFPDKFEDEEQSQVEATELLEWLSLVCLDSPRVRQGDKIDAFLSRYEVPDLQANGPDPKSVNIVKLHWHGFMPSAWVAKIFTAAIKASGDEWFAMQVCGFEAKNHVILKRDGKTLTWECE